MQVSGFATRDEDLDGLSVAASDYQGPTGIVGVLGDRLEEEGLPVVSLWAGLPHYINASPNPRGALALLQKLGQLLPLPHRRGAAQEERRRVRGADLALVASDAELSEYVRQLKKREFAS